MGRSPGEGNGYQLQYSFLENPINREAWWAYHPWGDKELDVTHRLSTHTHTHTKVYTILKIFHYRINWKRPSLEKTLMLAKIEGRRRRG